MAKQFTEQELQEAKDTWHCKTFRTLQAEAELSQCDKMVSDKWARSVKCLQIIVVDVTEVVDKEAKQREDEIGWTEATRELRRLRWRI